MNKIFGNTRFFAWAIGLAFDRLGNSVYTIILPLVVYHMTGSLGNMAILSVCQFVPRVFPGIYAGSIVDLSSKKSIFFIALLAQLFISIIIAGLYAMNQLFFLELCFLAALLSVFFEISRTAEMTLVPMLFPEDRVEATTILASVHTAMFMLGPIFGAALLIILDNYSFLLLLNALTYLAPLVMNRWTKIPSFKSSEYKNRKFGEKIHLTNNLLKEAMVIFSKNKSLQLLILFIAFIMLATGGLELIIIFHAKNTLQLSDQLVSLLYAAGAAGMFLGTLLVPVFKKMQRKAFLFLTLVIIVAGIVMFQFESISILLMAQFLTFAGVFACSVTKDIIIQEIAPPDMLGRISGLLRLASNVVVSLSALFLTMLSSMMSFQKVMLVILSLILISILLTQHKNFSSFQIRKEALIDE